MNKMKCCYCPETSGLRPYGPRGEMVCFDCAMGSPEREEEARRQLFTQIDAAGPFVVIDGSGVGPYPLKNNPAVRKIVESLFPELKIE